MMKHEVHREHVPFDDGGLSASATSAVRRAMLAELQDGLCGGDILAAVRALCVEGHRRQLHAEHLVIVLKDAWGTLPDIDQGSRHAHRGTFDRLVSECVREFYAPSAGRGSGNQNT